MGTFNHSSGNGPITLGALLVLCLAMACGPGSEETSPQVMRPNILLIITDDQSYPHASAYGFPQVQTPGFDRIAREGVLFTQAFAASPGCSPSRAALLTGRHCWQLEAAGTHASTFPVQYTTYPDLLEQAGYMVGYTGKGWGPGNVAASGRERNPAGPVWEGKTLESPEGISEKDYAGNFEDFLLAKPDSQPFCFWLGTHEPHRVFGKGLGAAAGKNPEMVEVPPFLPDHPEVRKDLLDYLHEIEWADRHIIQAIQLLEERGELDNTLIVVTSDNGMAFPRAKANVYEYGFHVPMAIRWGAQVSGGRISEELVGFVDLAPTFLEVAGVAPPTGYPMSGHSILPVLLEEAGDAKREAVFTSRERHSSSRWRSLSYPQRAMRTGQYLLIRNDKPERWPAGAPQKYGAGGYPQPAEVKDRVLGPMHGAYTDIDACPTLDLLVEHAGSGTLGRYLQLAVAHRPAVELFDIRQDPACLNDLARMPEWQNLKDSLLNQLETYLTETGDPRMTGQGDIWETYPRYSRLRAFPEPEWAKKNEAPVPSMPWLEEHWAGQLNQ